MASIFLARCFNLPIYFILKLQCHHPKPNIALLSFGLVSLVSNCSTFSYGDFFLSQVVLKFHCMQTWRCIWCVYYFKHRLESAACLPAPSLFFTFFSSSVACSPLFFPPVCLCIQRRVFWENNGREKLVIYHYTIMGALLPLEEVNLSERYHSPSLLTFCSH